MVSCWSWSMGRKRVQGWFHPFACELAVLPCLHGFLVFLHRHLLPCSPPSHLLRLFPCSQQQTSPWDCSPVPIFPLLAAVHSRGHASCPGYSRAVTRIVCVVLTPFRLSQVSYCTFQQPQMLFLCPKQLPLVGI